MIFTPGNRSSGFQPLCCIVLAHISTCTPIAMSSRITAALRFDSPLRARSPLHVRQAASLSSQ
ncbi:MAG: hypothetical protein Q8P41_00160 [Pseudomonadota bacterium]|nr:hypothetical protein [Pseudomonadota bacterium]